MKALASGLLASSLLLATAACGPKGPPPVEYTCTDGVEMQAQYPTDQSAFVQHEGRRVRMSLVISASGSRYAGDGLEWWTKGSGPGSEGTLSRLNSDGTSGDIIRQCHEK